MEDLVNNDLDQMKKSEVRGNVNNGQDEAYRRCRGAVSLSKDKAVLLQASCSTRTRRRTSNDRANNNKTMLLCGAYTANSYITSRILQSTIILKD